jgi:hypothetical protein
MILRHDINTTIEQGSYIWIIPLVHFSFIGFILKEFIQIFRELKDEYPKVNVLLVYTFLGSEEYPRTFIKHVEEVTWNIYMIRYDYFDKNK